MIYNIVISGVGGLGILTLGRILCQAALLSNKNAYMSEIHGLSQRYGSVVVDVRISDSKLLAPVVSPGEAHLLIGLEPIECLRVINFSGPNTDIILNTSAIPPPTVTLGVAKYPPLGEIIETLRKVSKRILACDILEEARKLGDPRLQNTIILGIAANIPEIPITSNSLEEAIKLAFSRDKRVQELNLKAFQRGLEIGKLLLDSMKSY
ncbi:MAG: indolepyruvate oxidoreductase subunit beta [Candidatus Korarchaeota archaeon]